MNVDLRRFTFTLKIYLYFAKCFGPKQRIAVLAPRRKKHPWECQWLMAYCLSHYFRRVKVQSIVCINLNVKSMDIISTTRFRNSVGLSMSRRPKSSSVFRNNMDYRHCDTGADQS